LENDVLGVRRTGADVPGWLIPSLYADYARTGNACEMPRILYHNVQDILSLVTLMARQCDLLREPLTPDAKLPGEDLYGLGRLFHELGQAEKAEAAYTQAAHTSQAPSIREMARRDLAYLLKRQERRAEALPWWQRLAEEHGAVYACEELAKHYEWQDEDLHQAVTWTQEALGLVGAWPRGRKRREAAADLEHRLDRLARKLGSGDTVGQ
jgi:tetratricopeptide (TPR) repeat protein